LVSPFYFTKRPEIALENVRYISGCNFAFWEGGGSLRMEKSLHK